METPEIDKALEDIETRVERLRALYEQYFMGIEKLEPQIPRKELERRIQVLRKEQIRNTAQRFKFNTVVQRYNTMQQHWMRIVREIENGTFRRDVIRAAQRFGEAEMMTLVGKKRAKQFAALAAAQTGPKRGQGHVLDEEMELDAADLIEDEEDEIEDEVPTPTRGRMAVTPPQPAWPAQQGLMPHDLPLVTMPARQAPPPAAPAPPIAAPPPSARGGSAGLRWGASSSDDPSSAVRRADAQRKLAEMAAELRGERPQQQEAPLPSFGSLDLDFDESPSGARVGPAGAKPAAASRPLPAAAPPPARAYVPAAAARAPAPAARAEQPAAGSGFGVLDIPFEDAAARAQPAEAARPVEAARPSSPGSGIRVGAAHAPRQEAKPAAAPAAQARPAPKPAADAAPRAAAGGDDDLSDQRIRQIYAKYVESKRATQESTAGVTFDKLAASLRAQANKLRSSHPSRAIDYEVVIKDGKTHLKPVLK
jgi:hypothetical protein